LGPILLPDDDGKFYQKIGFEDLNIDPTSIGIWIWSPWKIQGCTLSTTIFSMQMEEAIIEI
jgi:hypothetical protein